MPTIQGLIDSGDAIFENAETSLIKGVKEAETVLYEELIQILKTVSVTDGKLSTNVKAEEFLASLDRRIYRALKKANWDESVLRYTKDFEQIGQNVKDIQKTFNNISITDSQIKPILRLEVEATIDSLAGSGLAKDVVNPIRQQLYRNIYVGAPIHELEGAIKQFAISTPDSNSRLMQYAGQIATDAIHQFDGLLQSKISDELGLNALRYIGTLIKDSRAQCRKWVSENSGIWTYEQLAIEIPWALNGGTYHGKKCSGMIPGTVVKNFCVGRGGRRCRHRGIPTYLANS